MELIKAHGPGNGNALCQSGLHVPPCVAGTVHTADNIQVNLWNIPCVWAHIWDYGKRSSSVGSSDVFQLRTSRQSSKIMIHAPKAITNACVPLVHWVGQPLTGTPLRQRIPWNLPMKGRDCWQNAYRPKRVQEYSDYLLEPLILINELCLTAPL